MPSEVPRARLQDIVTNIDRVRAHLAGMKPDAGLDDKTRDAVERCLERISEAAKKLGASHSRSISFAGSPWEANGMCGNPAPTSPQTAPAA